MDERRPLRVGVAHDDPAVAGGLCAALRRRGHSVRILTAEQDLFAGEELNAVVLDVDHGSAPGLDLLERLRERDRGAHAVLVAAMPSLTVCRRALRLGAADLVPVPFTIDEVVASVEAAPVTESAAEHDGRRFVRAFPTTPEGVERGVRELSAHALSAGLGPAARARLAAAAHELCENARRHAYPDHVGAVRIVARAKRHELEVEISDRGAGFDPVAAQLDSVGAALPGGAAAERGLARAAALVEDLRVESTSRGTRVTLRVTGAPSALAGECATDLSDLDWLSPEHARAVVCAARGGDSPRLVGVSPALAVSIGRLLAGRTPDQAAQAALWS
jgi:anti-sigma regulatory factor (Ser/Thr protein kinase)